MSKVKLYRINGEECPNDFLMESQQVISLIRKRSNIFFTLDSFQCFLIQMVAIFPFFRFSAMLKKEFFSPNNRGTTMTHSRIIIAQGTTLILGKKFDIAKMLDTQEILLHRLTQHFGDGRSTVAFGDPGAFEHRNWPHPGKSLVRDLWTRINGMFDVCDASLAHTIGHFHLHAFLLGKTKCIYDK